MAIKLSVFTQSHYSFEGMRPEEEVDIFLYSHWLIPVMKFIYYALLTALPLVPLLFFAREIVEYEIISLIFFVLIAYYMLLWSIMFYEFMIYLLDTWIVTNERILDINQISFFIRTTAELDLSRVQDISVRTSGFIQTIFDFGDVEIQSAGAVNKFLFRQVAHPQMVKDKIMKLVALVKEKPQNPQV